jgi:hypothetical protein
MIKNENKIPSRFFGLHMVEGLAEYREPTVNNGVPYRILIGEQAIKNMDSTFEGRPLYVKHVDEVDLSKLKEQMDGVVVKSFFNKSDGKHWVEFMVTSDKGHEAIRNGWKLSNAYIPKKFAGGGLWHGVEYQKEVMEGEYEHLALVPNPRYEESIILTPEEFKTYNNEKEIELTKLSNSKTKGERSMFNFYKKTKIENSADFESTSVVLPKSGAEFTIAQVVNFMDAMEMHKKEEHPMANGDHYVEHEGNKMKLNDFMAMHKGMSEELKGLKESKNSESSEDQDKAQEEKKTVGDDKVKEKHAEDQDKEYEDKKSIGNDEQADGEAKEKALELAEHEEKEIEEAKKKKHNAANFDKLANAQSNAIKMSQKLELSEDRVVRGKSRYGSN